MPATIEPPAGVQIIDTGPPKPPPAPTKTIRVSEIPGTATPAAPAKRGSAMDRLTTDLRKKAGVEQPATPPAAAATPPKPSGSPTPEIPEPGSESPTNPPHPESGSQTPSPIAAEGEKAKGKVSPWKLVDQFKERATKAEAELLEARKNILPEQDRKSFETRVQTAEARVKELEDEIRHVNYQKSAEFQDKYQKPYEAAWKRAMTELSEITVTDQATQQVRAVSPQDMIELVNVPLGKAREIADQLFGPFADDVMAHRKEIRSLFEAQNTALEEAKKNGSLRDQQLREQAEKFHVEQSKIIKETWDKVNAQALEDPKLSLYFKPREGNQDWNQRLAKGFDLVDRAYAENVMDPKLSPEQRASVVQRHAAVRNRAASWGALRWENEQLTAKVSSLEKELGQYKESTPPAGGTVPNGQPNVPGSAMDRLKADLRKKAGL